MRRRCPRIIVETRTPGNRHSPDGPDETWETQCVLREGHEESHEYVEVWTRVYR